MITLKVLGTVLNTDSVSKYCIHTFSIITEAYLNQGNTTSARIASLSASGTSPTTNVTTDSSGRRPASPIRRRTSNHESKQQIYRQQSNSGSRIISEPSVSTLPPCVTGTASTAPSQQTPLPPRTRTPRSPPVFPFFRDSGIYFPCPFRSVILTLVLTGSPTPPHLRTILSNLPPTHAKFFNMLDAELEKVESFYAEREKEMNERAKRLREQLNELGVHRQMFYVGALYCGLKYMPLTVTR